MKIMDLKEYRPQPDSGLFEKIEQRLVRRRRLRIGAVATTVCAVAAGIVLLAVPASSASDATATASANVTAPNISVSVQPDLVATPTSSTQAAPITERPAVAAPVVTPTAIETKSPDTYIAQVHDSISRQQESTPTLQQPAPKPQQPTTEPLKQTSPTLADPVAESEPLTSTPTEPIADPGQPSTHIDNLLWAPNIFIPSSDDDGLRTFSLRFSSQVSDFRIRIYNRAGRQVFKSTDPHFTWDGTSSGTQMPQGAYVWVANFRDNDGNPHQENGTVTLVR